MTEPAVIVELASWVTLPAARPALCKALVAALWGCPTTLGTLTVLEPEEITKSTFEPGATRAPAAGVWRMTLPWGTVELASWVTLPAARPALCKALVAALWDCPRTSGTVIGVRPEERTRLTLVPGTTDVPARGSCLMILPAGTVELVSSRMFPTVSPAVVMAVDAALEFRPTTLGTEMLAIGSSGEICLVGAAAICRSAFDAGNKQPALSAGAAQGATVTSCTSSRACSTLLSKATSKAEAWVLGLLASARKLVIIGD